MRLNLSRSMQSNAIWRLFARASSSALATRLRVNPATVVQAYRDLEQEGLVEMRQGAGTFIADIPSDMRARERAAAAKRIVREMLAEAARMGIARDDLKRAFTAELEDARK